MSINNKQSKQNDKQQNQPPTRKSRVSSIKDTIFNSLSFKSTKKKSKFKTQQSASLDSKSNPDDYVRPSNRNHHSDELHSAIEIEETSFKSPTNSKLRFDKSSSHTSRDDEVIGDVEHNKTESSKTSKHKLFHKGQHSDRHSHHQYHHYSSRKRSKSRSSLSKGVCSSQSLNSDYDEEDYMDAFRLFDTNGDGRITAAELNHVLTELGIKTDNKEVQRMINELDIDHNGTVEYSEFVQMMTMPASKDEEFELREAFKCIDLDGNYKLFGFFKVYYFKRLTNFEIISPRKKTKFLAFYI